MHGFWILGFRRSRKISSHGCVKGANSWITGAVEAADCHDVQSPVIHQFAGFAQRSWDWKVTVGRDMMPAMGIAPEGDVLRFKRPVFSSRSTTGLADEFVGQGQRDALGVIDTVQQLMLLTVRFLLWSIPRPL